MKIWVHTVVQMDTSFKRTISSCGSYPGIDALGSPCVHLVYESDITWYKQMAEIVIEMIEFAMTLENPKLYGVHKKVFKAKQIKVNIFY